MRRRARIGLRAGAATFVALCAVSTGYPVAAAPQNDPRLGILGSTDHRVPVTERGWPWSSIGRVNRAGRSFCTGTLVAADRVLTAAHCVFDLRTGRKANPDELHFLAGYERGDFRAESAAQKIIIDERYRPKPPASGSVGEDWAILVLKHRIELKPILPEDPEGLAASLKRGTLVRAGYGQDRPHLLVMHRGCSVDEILPDLLLHDCDSTHGDSGSPLLLFEGARVRLVGVHVAILGGEHRRGAAVPVNTFAAAIADSAR